MKLVTVCKICGHNLATTWDQTGAPQQIHPMCDDRPANQRGAPHPAEGQVRTLAHELTLALAAAADTHDGSPQWQQFDTISQQLHLAQQAERGLPLPQVAMAYATELGWPVFPLAPSGKTPLTKNGFKNATTDPDMVRGWWEQNPHANIGLPTGITFNVIDVDTPTHTTIWEDIAADPDTEVHGFAWSASGGYHAYVKPEVGESVKNRANAFGPGIDFRTTGGYVVAPWSRKAGGGMWQWWSMPSNDIRGRAGDGR